MKEKSGNRIIQILLLLIIAGGFFGIMTTLKGSAGAPGGRGFTLMLTGLVRSFVGTS